MGCINRRKTAIGASPRLPSASHLLGGFQFEESQIAARWPQWFLCVFYLSVAYSSLCNLRRYCDRSSVRLGYKVQALGLLWQLPHRRNNLQLLPDTYGTVSWPNVLALLQRQQVSLLNMLPMHRRVAVNLEAVLCRFLRTELYVADIQILEWIWSSGHITLIVAIVQGDLELVHTSVVDEREFCGRLAPVIQALPHH
jgi:hypothetical protein